MELYTDRLYMRQLNASDWVFFRDLHSDPSVIQYVCDIPSETATREKFESRLPQWLPGSSHWLCLVVVNRHSGIPIGVTGLKRAPDENATAEVGYLLCAEHHGKGYGFESLQQVMAYARDTLRLTVLTAVVTDGNTSSCHLLEKCGFQFQQRNTNAYRLNGQMFDDLVYRYQMAEPSNSSK